MSAWIGQVPALLLAAALLVVPGLPVGLLVRGVRGIVRLGIAIGVSLGVIGAATLLAPVIGMSWGFLPIAIVAIPVWIVAGVLRGFDRQYVDVTQERRIGAWIAVGAAGIGWLAVLAYGIGSPVNPSQLYDALFHLNAVEFIAQTGDASPLHMTMAVPTQETSFYPTLWHALVSLVVPLAGDIVAATNIVTLAVVALIWPTALAMLSSVAFPRREGVATWAPLVAFGFVLFPLGFLNWGGLYPSLLGTVLVPILIACVILAFAPGLSWSARILRILIALAVAGGTALGHPSALLTAIAFIVPYVVWQVLRAVRHSTAKVRYTAIGSIVVGLGALSMVWAAANVTTNEWLPSQTLAQTVGEVALLSPVGRQTGLLIGVLAAIGIVRVLKDRQFWILVSYGISVALFIVAQWLPILSLRSLIVGVWYDDATRVGALLAIWALPLAGLGASELITWLRGLWRRGRRVQVVGVIVLIAVAGASNLLPLREELRQMRNVSFKFGVDSQGLSSDEAALFEKADQYLDENDLVIGDPLTGAALLYAYTGYEVVFPHVTGSYGSDAATLARGLADGGDSVCEAVQNLGVTYAFDFGDTVLFQNHYTNYDGLHDLDESPILTEVARVGDAALYEITGCDQ